MAVSPPEPPYRVIKQSHLAMNSTPISRPNPKDLATTTSRKRAAPDRGFFLQDASAKLFDSQPDRLPTTRIYDPRTHIFRSKNAYSSDRNQVSPSERHGAQEHGTTSKAATPVNDLGIRTVQPTSTRESNPILLSTSEGLHTHWSCFLAPEMRRSSLPSELLTTRSNDDFWRETIQAPSLPPMLFDANRLSPIMKHDSTPPVTTRVYDPRTHIFRSKKALDSGAGPSLFPGSLI
jgi:hypothetical protein